MRAENELNSGGITKSQIKKLINEEKESIIDEIKDSQRSFVKKEVNSRVQNDIQDLEK